MSLRLKRYNANESEFTRTGRNKATFDLPASAGFVDLTQSKLVLDMRMDVTDYLNAESLHPATFGRGGEMVGAKSLLRHCRVKSTQNGVLDERRHINVVDSNLDWNLRSRDLEDSESLFGNTVNDNYGFDRASGIPDNPWLMIQHPKEGETKTRNDDSVVKRRAEIPIDMHHLTNLGSIKQLPMVALGELRVEVEFEDQFNVAFPVVQNNRAERLVNRDAVANLVGSSAAPLATVKTPANFNRPPQEGDVVHVSFREHSSGDSKYYSNVVITSVADVGTHYNLVFGTGLATTAATESCTNIHMVYNPVSIPNVAASATGQLGSAANPIVMEAQGLINDKGTHHVLPFYPKQQIYASCHYGATNLISTETGIVNTVSIVGDKLHITLVTPLTVTNGQAINNIVLASRDWDTNSELLKVAWTIDEAYIELAELQLTPQQQEGARKALADLEIPFLQHRLLQKDMPATTLHTDIVHALPNCAGLAVLTPQNLRMLSGWDGCERYRFAINGIENTNRDIHVYDANAPRDPRAGRQLHNHMLRKYWANLGKSLKKYDANVSNYTAPDDQRLHSFFPLVTPMIPSEQTIQIQLMSDNDTMGQKSIFYVFTHPRVLKISNGRVSIN